LSISTGVGREPAIGFIEEACGSDKELRREVESPLLRYDKRKNGLNWRRSPSGSQAGPATRSTSILTRKERIAPSIVRISDHKLERLVSLKNLRLAGSFGWTGLAQDDSPLVLLYLGTQEIYALYWEAP